MGIDDIVSAFVWTALGRLRLVLLYIGFWIAFVCAVMETYEAATTNWIVTEAQFVKCRSIFDRTRNGHEEYYYTMDYKFIVGGAVYNTTYDNAFSSRELAETTRSAQIKEAAPITIWYRESDPSDTELYYIHSEWKMLCMLSIMLFIIIVWITRVIVRRYAAYVAAKVS